MATAESLVAALQAYTEAGTTLPAADALECVNLTVRDMQRRHDFRFMQQSVDLIITGGTVNSVELPLDFLREVYVYTRDTGQSNPSDALFPIQRVLKPHWFEQRSPLANVDPTFPNVAAPALRTVVTDARGYYVWAGKLWIVPTPSSAITISLDYSRIIPDLVLGEPTPDFNDFTIGYPDVVRAGALAEAYDFLHEEGRATRWDGRYEKRLKAAVDADNAIAFAGPSPKRGA